MNIAFYVNSFLPTVGGKEIVVHYLAREMLRMGHKVHVVGPSGWISRRKFRLGYPVHRWPTLRGLFTEQVMYRQLALDTTIFGSDIIHAHTTYPNGYIAALLKRRRRVPMVITPHGYDIHMIPELGFGHRLDPEKRAKISIALQAADAVTAISDSIRTSLVEAGCPESKIIKIPNGIDLGRFQNQHPECAQDLADIRQWLNLPQDARLILNVGNYHPRKGQDVLLRAMQQVSARFPQACLIVVGNRQEPLAEKVRALQMGACVRLTGPIPFPLPTSNNGRRPAADRLSSLYRQSEIYVSAGIDQEAEGLSLATLDAMAAGLPVVATDISGNSEVVINGKTGRLVPPADDQALARAIVATLEQKKTAVEMGRQGQAAALTYHWREIAGQYLEVYRSVM